jgi:hypothetical protein
MRKITVVILGILFFSMPIIPARAAWVFERLTDNNGHALYPSVAAVGNNVNIFWTDTSYGGYDILYKRSWTSGAAFQVFQRISDNSGTSTNPAAAAYIPDGYAVHLVWEDDTYGNYDIFYKRSTDYGASWSFQRLTANSGKSISPAVAVSGSNVHIVWADDTYGNNEIFSKRSTDAGSTWAFQRLSNNSGDSDNPSVACSGNIVHVVWEDLSYGVDDEIFYKRSTDYGATWSFQRLTNVTHHSTAPSVAVSGSTVHVAWRDAGTFGNVETFYKRSTDYGATWAFQRLTNNSGISGSPSVSCSGTNVAVVWQDNSYGQDEIFCKRSNSNGSTWTFDRISNNSGASQRPSVSQTGSDIHIVWDDDTYGDWEIFYKRGP